MSTSPFGQGADTPRPVSPHQEQAAKDFAAAMYRACDALRRCGYQADFSGEFPPNIEYLDKQLMYAGQQIDQARVAVVAFKNPPVAEVETMDDMIARQQNRGRPMFPSDGPDERGA